MDRHAPGSHILRASKASCRYPSRAGLRSGPGPSSRSKTFQITLRAPAGAVLEAELLGGVWSLKPFERQRDLVGRSDYESADLAHFLPRRADCPLRKGYRTRMDHGSCTPYRTNVIHVSSSIEEVSLSFQSFVSLSGKMLCAASIPRLHPPISVHLLPLQCMPNPPFPPLPRSDPSRMPLWPSRFSNPPTD